MPPPLARSRVLLEPDFTGFRAKSKAGFERETRGLGREASRRFAEEMRGAATATGELSSALDKAHFAQRGFARGAFAATLAATGLRGAVLAAGTGFLTGAGIIRGIERFLGLTVDFERSMNTLQAVTAATSFEMNQAGKAAIALGADLTLPSVSAKDAADAMTELARGGFDVQESMDGARGALTLATAAGTDFATAAQIAARAINAFHLEASDTLRVADALANAANRSTGEITDMAISLQQSSAVAHQTGLTMEDTVTAISLLANAGLVGSDAGTSLRTTLLRLVPQSKEAEEAMADLGVRTTDAAGRIRSVPAIFQDFREALAPLPEEMRQAALNTIFGADAIRAASIFIEAGATEFERMRLAINEEGAAAELAAARSRGLSGAFGALQSNVETLFVSLSTKLAPAATQIVTELNAMVTAIAHSDETAQLAQASFDVLTVAFTAIGAAAQVAAVAIEPVADVIGDLTAALGGTQVAAFAISLFVLSRGLRAVQSGFVPFSRLINSATGRTAALAAATGELAAAQRVGTAATTEATAATAARLRAEEAQFAMLGRLSSAELRAANVAHVAAQQRQADAAALLAGRTAQVAALRGAGFTGGGGAGQVRQRGRFASAEEARRVERALAAEQRATQRLIASNIALGSTDARLTAEKVRLGTAMGKTTTLARNLGSGLLAMAGGPVGVATIAIAGLAAGLLYLVTRASAAERALRQLEDATDVLAVTQETAEQSARNYADAIDAKAMAETAVRQAQLNEAIAEDILLNSAAAEGSREREQLQIDLANATQATAQAEENLRRATEDVVKAGDKRDADLRRNREAQTVAVNLTNKRLRAILAEELGVKRLNAETVREARARSGATKFAIDYARATSRMRDEQIRLAAEFREEGHPAMARARELVAEFIKETGRIPQQFQLRFLLNIDDPKLEKLRDPITFRETIRHFEELGFSAAEAFNLAMQREAKKFIIPAPTVDEAFVEGLEAPSRALALKAREFGIKSVGVEWGQDLIAGLVQGIETEESRALEAAEETLRDVIRAGNEAIADSVTQAKTGLSSLGSTLGDQIGQILDAGPVGRKIRNLQNLLDRLDRASERRDLTRDRQEALRELAEARRSLSFTEPLTAEQAARQRRRAADFLRPYEERVRDANENIRRFNIEGTIDRLTEAQEEQKERVKRNIADTVAAYQAGLINMSTFNERIATILGNQRGAYRVAGRSLGFAFRAGFERVVEDLFAQAAAMVGFTTGRFAGVPGAKIERPRQVQVEVARRTAKAQEDLRKATEANKKATKELTTAINKLRLTGLAPGKAQKQAVINVEGAVIIRPPKKGNR